MATYKQRIERDGFCVIEQVIPKAEVEEICAEIVAAVERNHRDSEAELAAIRRRGHRIGNPGVAQLRQVINQVQSFAPYLADRRLLEVVESFFGAWARISCTDCVINHSGNARGYWHADWPYNATNASHIPSPYPDAVLHLSTIWMLTPFSAETGGTFVVPGSHRWPRNPAAGDMPAMDQDASYPTECQIEGTAGSVLVYDSRLWHAVASNQSKSDRVALIVRYAPWWLNLNPTLIGRPEHEAMVVETGGKNYEMVPIEREVFDRLPKEVKLLYRHWVAQPAQPDEVRGR
ncbi:MAG: phytanoyl-CoA dioxygenase family protein [Gemmatimonadetes bacterium]|nr:phytanoyl-CoA dioxygenase family protein [Gemmatimonadota bacterium]